MCSNANFNPFVFGIRQKLSLGDMSVILFAADILLKKPTWRQKTNIKKRAALSCYIYALVNKEKGCLQKIILENYKEWFPSTSGQSCCFNCNSILQAFKEFNICKLHIKGVLKKMQ